MTRTKKSRARRASKISLLMAQPREIGAAEFKVHCLELMDEVERVGAEIVITKHRKPVARLVPVRPNGVGIIGCLKGAILEESDLISPIDVVWSADESNLT